MRAFIKKSFNTDQIDKINLDELKRELDGETMLSRNLKYKRGFSNMLKGKKAPVGKYEIVKNELVQADKIKDADKNENFGFKCLHYSVSEASGSIKVAVLNKSR